MSLYIYVASSWRNPTQPAIVQVLKEVGHLVYDFRNPAPGNDGFRWSDIHTDWKNWSLDAYQKALEHPIAQAGFELDFTALVRADACVLVMPCGRSAHLEAGYAIGRGIPTCILLSDAEPELMYKMAARLCTSLPEVLEWLKTFGPRKDVPL